MSSQHRGIEALGKYFYNPTVTVTVDFLVEHRSLHILWILYALLNANTHNFINARTCVGVVVVWRTPIYERLKVHV